jgi:hypothetical protein
MQANEAFLFLWSFASLILCDRKPAACLANRAGSITVAKKPGIKEAKKEVKGEIGHRCTG